MIVIARDREIVCLLEIKRKISGEREMYVFSETPTSQHHNVVLHHTHTHTLTPTLTLTHT